MLRSLTVGGVAALVATVLWVGVALATGGGAGYMAWLIGVGVGVGVLLTGGPQHGAGWQVATSLTLSAVLLGRLALWGALGLSFYGELLDVVWMMLAVGTAARLGTWRGLR